MRTKLLAIAMAASVVLAGCSTVPTKGPIRSGSQAGLAPPQAGVNVKANPPRPNTPPLALVNGYLEAMSDSSNFDQARQYMTPEAAAAWKPESKLSVYDQSSTSAVSLLSNGSVELKARLIGTIDDRGSWTPARQGESVDVVFRLADVEGQKRVSNAPDGAYLGSNQFESRLTARSLYFLTPDRQTLVPDPVFLPINLPPGQAATQLIQELLKGPTSRLAGGVVTAAPPGTQVNVSVPVELTTATVALSDAAQVLGDQERRQLAAQILWTLRNVSPRVRITVGGAPLLDDQPDVLSIASFSQYDPAASSPQLKELYGLRAGKVQHITGLDGAKDIASVPLNDSLLYEYNADSLAVNLRGDAGAIVVHNQPLVGYARLDATDKADKLVTIKTSGKVLRPSYDYQENLWILDRADSANPRLRVRNRDGKVSDVATDFHGDTPVALRMAPDGVRALLMMRRASTGQNYVETATVQLNDAKQPKLGGFRPLELPLTNITDVSWNQSGILVAGRSSPNALAQPWQVNTDGSQTHLLPGASTEFATKLIASNPSADTFPVVEDTSGALHWQLKDLSWQMDDETSKSPYITPVYPG
ncbi:LpqB family beta-propeller domain-containing protein [Kribbella monticola]|uniref:LpqB family beta-propeller domain-containing protein n=1 Tax=Kribbella monticola TaxID=2185285 RepID=UPI000DD40C19|nr:LpqB family beta-propeller domain-containing protein [Kribbella monticola]